MLKDKVVVLTGAAGLLGRTFSMSIASQGATVVVADIDEDAARRTAHVVTDAGYRAMSARIDISDPALVERVIEATHERCGQIDAVVNNAYPRNPRYGRKLEEVTYGDFAENTSLNLAGYFLVSQRFSAYFVRQGHGNIVNIASIYGVIAPKFQIYDGTSMTMPVEYAAIKSGVLHLTRYFAQYFKRAGVRCNSLSPGGILDRQPEAFVRAYGELAGTTGMLAPQDVAGALTFLLSDGSRHMTGQNLVVDDGFSL